jgi:uncharacterized membrane protein YkvA (DUF1232 family)
MDLTLVLGIVLAVVGVWAFLLVILWLFRPKNISARELVRLVPDVLRLLRRLVGDRAVPLDVRLVLVGLVLWIINPIDLIPEFIPVVGPLDDAIVAVLALRYARRRIGLAGIKSRWDGTADGFALLERVIGS